MNRGKIAVITVSVLMGLVPVAARAQDPVPKTTEEARKQFEAADAELNRVYQRCYSGTTVQSQEALKGAQRLWVEERDGTATAYQTGESSRKQLQDNYYFYARMVVTQSRTKELQTLFLNQ